MSKKKATYTEEFKKEAVELLLTSEQTIDEIAENLGVSRGSLTNWNKRFGNGKAKPRGNRIKSGAELQIESLQREVAVLKKEREILKKAAAFFAKELH